MRGTIFISIILALVLTAGAALATGPDTLWTRYIGTSATDHGYAVKQTADGGFIVAGMTAINGNPDVYLLKVDADGDSLWDRTYGGPEEDYAYGIDVCSDGGFILTGYTGTWGTGAAEVYVIRTDANGDSVWARSYGSPGSDRGNSVIESDVGGFLVVGTIYTAGVGNEIYMIKLYGDGDVAWSQMHKAYGHTNGNEVQEMTLGGQYYAIAATCQWKVGLSEAFLVKTNELGDTLWTAMYGGLGQDYGYDAEVTADGGLIMVGYGWPPPHTSYDVYLVRTGPGASVDPREPDPDLRLVKASPNPFSTSVRVSYILSAPARVSADVFDIRGRRVSRLLDGPRDVGCRSLAWDGTDSNGTRMPPGIYFLRLRAGAASSVEKIVLVE